jgi:hypothetical protein
VGRGIRVRRESIERFVTPIAPKSNLEDVESDTDLGKPFTMDDPLWNIVGIGRSDDSVDFTDDEEQLPTVLELLGISIGIGQSGEPTNIAEHKDE